MGRKLFTILIALAIGGTLSAALLVSLSRQREQPQLVGGQPLDYWVKCLDSGNMELRDSAAVNLPRFGETAVPALVERLDADPPELADAASSALAKIGSPGVRTMARALRSGAGTPARRNAIIALLGQMGAVASAPAVPAIAACLEDPNVGHAATEYFLQCGAGPVAVDAAARALLGKDDYRRRDALRILRAASGDPRACDALSAAMDRAEPNIRDAIWRELCAWPTLTPPAVTKVAHGLSSAETRGDAQRALLNARWTAAAPLAQFASDPAIDDTARVLALQTLAQILMRSRPVIAGGGAAGIEGWIDQSTRSTSPNVRAVAQECFQIVRSARAAASATTFPTSRPAGAVASGSPSWSISSSTAPVAAVPPAAARFTELPVSDAPTSAPAIAAVPVPALPSLPAMSASTRKAPLAVSIFMPADDGAGRVIASPIGAAPTSSSKSSAAAPSNAVLDNVLAQLDDADDTVRASAENAVRYLAPACDLASLDFTATSDPAERVRRVRLLQFCTDPQRYDLMIAASRDPDPAMRRAAVGGMRRSLDSPKVVERLLSLLRRDDAASVRAASATALTPLRYVAGVRSALLTAARSDPDPTVSTAARKALDRR